MSVRRNLERRLAAFESNVDPEELRRCLALINPAPYFAKDEPCRLELLDAWARVDAKCSRHASFEERAAAVLKLRLFRPNLVELAVQTRRFIEQARAASFPEPPEPSPDS